MCHSRRYRNQPAASAAGLDPIRRLTAPSAARVRDNGSIYTPLETLRTADRLHLVPSTTPPSTPQSNGMSEAFVNTLRRGGQAGADLSTSWHALAQILIWIADNDAVAPHSALGYQSPQQYRRTMLQAGLMSKPELPYETGYTARMHGPLLTRHAVWTVLNAYEAWTPTLCEKWYHVPAEVW